jgi:hypothetical protein
MLSRYLAEEPNFTERLLFNLPKESIAAQKTGRMLVCEETTSTSKQASETEGFGAT